MGFLKYKSSLQTKKGIFNVLIIGAGNIGAFYDTPDSKNILTHAHAIKEHSGFKLVGFVDNNSERARVAAKIWKTLSFQSINEAFSKTDVDVVCVAVPDEFHYTVLKEVVFRPVKIVLAEKPITKTLFEADEIIALYKQLNVSLLVNYSRRFVPEFQDVKKLIDDQSFGKYVFGNGYYGKGVLHNGSHMINLLEYLIGDVKEVEVKEKVFDLTF
jgi:predicted dehydrogenase